MNRCLLSIFIWVTVGLLSCFSLQAQRILLDLKEEGMVLKELFTRIEKQTDFTIAFGHSKIDTTVVINLQEENMPLEELLDRIILYTGGDYKIHENHIIFSGFITEPAESVPGVSAEQIIVQEKITFRGIVTDSITREPLVYATIVLLDKNENVLQVTVTNDTGEFSLDTTILPAALRISYIGYEPLIVQAGSTLAQISGSVPYTNHCRP